MHVLLKKSTQIRNNGRGRLLRQPKPKELTKGTDFNAGQKHQNRKVTDFSKPLELQTLRKK